MANDTTKVTAGQPKPGGYSFIAPVGTALPTDATTTLNVAFECLGYISEDGVTETPNMESEDILDWGGDVVLSPLTSKTTEWSAEYIESMNEVVLKMVYGDDNVTVAANGAITITGNADDLEPQSFVFEMKQTGNIPYRLVIPKGKISSIAETTYARGSAVGYNVTIKGLPDATGNSFYKYYGVA